MKPIEKLGMTGLDVVNAGFIYHVRAKLMQRNTKFNRRSINSASKVSVIKKHSRNRELTTASAGPGSFFKADKDTTQ